jgi:hypothetical protein
VGQLPGRRVGLLAEDRDVADAALVLLDEALGLDEHAAGAAAGVEDAALVRLQHPHQQADDAHRREELAAELAFRRRELAEEILVDVAEQVTGPGVTVTQGDRADEVNQFPELVGGDVAAGVLGRQHAAQPRVGPLDRLHGRVDDRGDVGLLRVVLQL